MAHDAVVKRTIATMAAIAAAAAGASHASAASPDPNSSYSYRTLNNPTTGDAFMFRGAIQQNAQTLSDKLFEALKVILGGQAPKLNFVPTGSQFAPTNMAANLRDRPGAPVGQINVDPLAVESLTNFNSPYHSSGVQSYPHEFAHLRQTLAVLSDFAQREGGAQAFTDLVTPVAAQRAGIPFTPDSSYDGSFASLAQQAHARGTDWLTGGQFGHAPVPWP